MTTTPASAGGEELLPKFSFSLNRLIGSQARPDSSGAEFDVQMLRHEQLPIRNSTGFRIVRRMMLDREQPPLGVVTEGDRNRFLRDYECLNDAFIEHRHFLLQFGGIFVIRRCEGLADGLHFKPR